MTYDLGKLGKKKVEKQQQEKAERLVERAVSILAELAKEGLQVYEAKFIAQAMMTRIETESKNHVSMMYLNHLMDLQDEEA